MSDFCVGLQGWGPVSRVRYIFTPCFQDGLLSAIPPRLALPRRRCTTLAILPIRHSPLVMHSQLLGQSRHPSRPVSIEPRVGVDPLGGDFTVAT